MVGRGRNVALPPEIVAARRQRRQRTLRLYGIAVGAVLVLIVGILVGYGSLFSAGIATDARFSNAFNAASTAMSKGDVQTAERELRTAMAIRDSFNLRYDLGVVLLKEGRYAASLAQWQKAAAFKRLPDVYWYAAIAALAMRRPALARDQAQVAVKLDPIEGYYHAALAMAEQALGHNALAAREYATARGYDYQGQTIRDWIAQAGFLAEQARPGGS